MALLNRDDILAQDNLNTEDVSVPEWGGEVRVREMTASDRDTFEARFANTEGKANMNNVRAELVSKCVVDEEGNRLFTKEDMKKLADKSASAMDRIFQKTLELSGMSQDSQEEEVKN